MNVLGISVCCILQLTKGESKNDGDKKNVENHSDASMPVSMLQQLPVGAVGASRFQSEAQAPGNTFVGSACTGAGGRTSTAAAAGPGAARRNAASAGSSAAANRTGAACHCAG